MSERRVKIAVELGGAGRPLVIRVESRSWLTRRKTELRVDDQGLTVTGDLGGHRRGMVRTPWEKLAELHYAPAGHGMVEGLYAREGLWCSRCVLPRLNEAEADEAINAVTRQFPGKLMSFDSVRADRVAEHPPRRGGWWPIFGRRHHAVAAAGMGGRT